jgi:hypothetical protein
MLLKVCSLGFHSTTFKRGLLARLTCECDWQQFHASISGIGPTRLPRPAAEGRLLRISRRSGLCCRATVILIPSQH